MKFRGLLALACAAMLMAGCNSRNRTSNTIATSNEAGTTGTAGAGISATDRNFVNDMLSDGMAEVELARMAKDHAASPDVKQFAQMMIDDHTKAGDQLKQNGVEILSGPESHENGKFAHIMDPDGNKVELWEPLILDEKNKSG